MRVATLTTKVVKMTRVVLPRKEGSIFIPIFTKVATLTTMDENHVKRVAVQTMFSYRLHLTFHQE